MQVNNGGSIPTPVELLQKSNFTSMKNLNPLLALEADSQHFPPPENFSFSIYSF